VQARSLGVGASGAAAARVCQGRVRGARRAITRALTSLRNRSPVLRSRPASALRGDTLDGLTTGEAAAALPCAEPSIAPLEDDRAVAGTTRSLHRAGREPRRRRWSVKRLFPPRSAASHASERSSRLQVSSSRVNSCFRGQTVRSTRRTRYPTVPDATSTIDLAATQERLVTADGHPRRGGRRGAEQVGHDRGGDRPERGLTMQTG